MPRRTIPFGELWNRHERLYRHIFVQALIRLAAEPRISGNENSVSKHLFTIVVTVCREIANTKNREIHPPASDGLNQPVNVAEAQEDFTRKRPDFTCNCVNPRAESNEDYLIPFHVECKLLGEPTSRTWKLNTNYVMHGIARFDLASHRYGNRASSGIMIGYIISMTSEQIQTQVNSCIEKKLPGVPLLVFALSDVPSQSQHSFARRHVVPTPFTLIHLWVDIRNNYQGKHSAGGAAGLSQ